MNNDSQAPRQKAVAGSAVADTSASFASLDHRSRQFRFRANRFLGGDPTLFFALCLVLTLSVLTGCQTSSYAERGALVGGATGTALGAAIGENSGNPLFGAIAGTAAGMVVGSAVGEGIDRDFARAQSPGPTAVPPSGAVNVQQIVAMSANGLGPDVISYHVQANGLVAPLTSDDLIYLKANGVSDQVITSLQSAAIAARPPAAVAVPTSVIVEEHHYVQPYWHPHHAYHRGHPYPGRARVGFSFSSHH